MKDHPANIAFNAAAPAGERFDAQAQLTKTYRPLSSEIMPADDIRPVIDAIRADLEEQDAMMKARGPGVIPFPGQKSPKERGMKSVYLDDLQIFAHGDYFEKPSPMGFDALRNIVEQTPVLNAVILTRIRQVSRFCSPQESGDGPGFVIRHIDKDHSATVDEKQSMQLLTRFINNCGWEFNPRARKRLRRDNFVQFIAKTVRDSLCMDSSPIETEFKRDRRKGIDGFYAVDGATVRLCSDDGYRGDDEIFALQVVQGRICATYTHDDLIYEVRNPRTDVRLAGYGMGETELLVRVVTGWLNAMTYNIKGFDDNNIPHGILHLSGDYGMDDLTAFKRYWNAMVKGINNAWSLPVLVSKDQESKASFERFGVEFNEMYFSKWMTFLTSIICAVYGMSPAEINFDSFTGGNTSALSGSDTAEKLAASQDKGLRPLMAHIESIVSDYIISDFSDKYVFRWAGLDEEDRDKRHEMRKLILTMNEARAQEGYGSMDGPLGDAPLNPSMLGAWQQLQQAQQQGQDGQEDYGQAPDDENEESGNDADFGDDGDRQEDDKSTDIGNFEKSLSIYVP
jgi:hypothetical protein